MDCGSLSARQLRKFDEIAVEKFGIPSVVLMENAGLDATCVALKMLCDIQEPTVIVLVGSGNNGGDGLVLARHLFNNGINPEIFVFAPFEKFKGDALINLNICRNMELNIICYDSAKPEEFFGELQKSLEYPDLVVDAMLGTGLKDAPREPYMTAISILNSCESSILSLDIPSGLDADSGRPTGDDAVHANCTVTFAALKQGFDHPEAIEYTGDIILAGIGITPYLLLKHAEKN